MFDVELNSFLVKFHPLRKSGATAHLDVDTHAGQAWVGLRVMLGPLQHQPVQRHRSPSYFRRQERRRAARQSSEESDKVVAEKVATDSKEENAVKAVTSEKNAAEAISIDQVANDDKAEEASKTKASDDDLKCELCDFTSNKQSGLHIHMSKKHATIEQLDGNMTFLESSESDDDLSPNWNVIEKNLEDSKFIKFHDCLRP